MVSSTQNNFKKNKNNISSDTITSREHTKSIKEQISKKGTIKRRTSDLTLSKASATAIIAQAHHTNKQAFKANNPNTAYIKNKNTSNRIPIRVRIFFWCSLLLFCISFYQAIVRPQLEISTINTPKANILYWMDITNNTNEWEIKTDEEFNKNSENQDSIWVIDSNNNFDNNPSINIIQTFFYHLSNKDFDKSFELLTPSLQKASEIKDHFTAFRIIPFLEWIEWWTLSPNNFQYISSSTYWRDKYSFELTYTLSSNQETYNETREFVVDTKWDSPKITSIVCITPKCSYHPIFRPENFGLMR